MENWSGTSSSVFAGVYNAKRSNTNKWRAARGCVRAGVRNATIVCSGNSITGGYNATGNTSLANMASRAYPTLLAQALNRPGLPASSQSFIGGNNYADFNAADSRIVMGDWTNAGLGSFGANVLQKSTIGGVPMSFTPLTPVDTVQLLATRNLSAVGITVAVDGGNALATYSPFASGTLQIGMSQPISLGSLAAHAIQANLSSATLTFLIGMIAYNSAVKEVSVLRAGWHGGVIANFLNANWTYTDGIKVVAPDLILPAMTRNDASSGTDLATFTSNYQQVINAGLLSGDVILIIEPLGSQAVATYGPYRDAIYHLAQVNDLALIDFTVIWDHYTNTSSWYGDTIHPNGFAYGEMGGAIADILMML